jgi:hypothetical protein
MRFVHDKLVFRLHRPLSEALLDEINARFGDILIGGRFVVGRPLPEEEEEVALADMPRLIFHFNRRSFGRLRMLIDCVNGGKREETIGDRQ